MRASRKLIRAFVVPRTISLRHESPAQAQARDLTKSPRLAEARDSDVHGNLQAGLLKLILEGREFSGELSKFPIAEFRKDKLVQGFLLGGQVCDVLVGLVRQ